MRHVLSVLLVGLVAACAPKAPSQGSNHQNLDTEACRVLAQETFAKGELNYNLCPGYAPDGQKIELF